MLAPFVAHTFLEDLGLVLCVAAVTTVIFQWIRQPVVVGYLIAGMIVGPHVPIPLFADPERIHALSELGVILLMFALGLEFSIRKLLRLGPTAGFVTALQVGLMVWLGYVAARAMGWTELEGIFTGAALSISSTTIVAKAYAEQGGISRHVSDLVFGVLLAEDLTAVMMLAVLTAIASGAGLSVNLMLGTVGKLTIFLIALVGAGLLIVPWIVRRVVRLQRAETTLVACIGVCFAFAIIAEHAGYSVALGAFLAGSLVAESGDVESIEHLVAPVRDIFGAVFFVSVGMMIDPAVMASHWQALSLLVLTVIVGKLFGVTLASLLSGVGVSGSVQAGMSLTQIGEFSFIIADLGIKTHATREFLYTLAVAVSAITTFTTPFMIRGSLPLAHFIANHVPARLSAMQGMYDSLMERIRRDAVPLGAVLGSIATIAVGAIAIAVIMIFNDVDFMGLTVAVQRFAKVTLMESTIAVDLAAFLACVPFIVAMYLGARQLARTLVLETLSMERARDATGALTGPAEALVSVLRTTILVVVALPLLAIVQPFLEPFEGVVVLSVGAVLMGVAIWRSVQKVHGQLPLLRQLLSQGLTQTEPVGYPTKIGGFGIVTPVRLEPGASAIGRTLASIDLRAVTGAAAIAISRDREMIEPNGNEVLREGDVVGLTGTSESIEAARRLLSSAQPANA